MNNLQPTTPEHVCSDRQPLYWLIGLVLLIFLFSLSIQAAETSDVVIVKSEQATSEFIPDFSVVQSMLDTGLIRLTGKETSTNAIQSLVTTNDVIGIKIYTLANGIGGTRPDVVRALIVRLIEAGISTNNIIIWDRSWEAMISSGFTKLASQLGVQAQATQGNAFDDKIAYSSFFPSSLVSGDVEFGKKGTDVGRRSFVTQLLTKKITRVILVTPLMHHNQLGVAGNIYSLASGSVDNFLRFENDGDRLAEAAAEIYAMEAVGDKVVLVITDALICQYRGQNESFLHYSKSLNELRLSKDPVALDWLALKTMMLIREEPLTAFANSGKILGENAVLLSLGHGDDSLINLTEVNLTNTSTTPLPSADNSPAKHPWWKFWKR